MAAVSTGPHPPAPAPYELRFDSGRLCLDLVATAHPDERLTSPDLLRTWLVGAGLVPNAAQLADRSPAWLAAFRELRGHIAHLVRGELSGRPVPGALERVNLLARAAPPAPRAVRAADGTLVRSLHMEPGCPALLAAVARDTIDLLTDPAVRGALRQCEGDNCPIIYLDMSRGRRRRWCSSEVCGNRERVARHRRRAAALARA